MLKYINKGAHTWFAFLMAIPIVASFVLMGISDMLHTRGGTNEAARVGSQKVTVQEVDQVFHQQLKQYQAQGLPIDAKQAKALKMGDAILDSLIERRLLLAAADDDGLRISNDRLAAEIRQIKGFQDEKGKFMPDKFKAALQNAGLSEATFTTGMKQDMAIKLFLSALQPNATVPPALINTDYLLGAEKRTADIYQISPTKLPVPAAPKDEALNQYYTDHKERYELPEQRKFTVAVLDPVDLMGKQTVGEDEISAFYQKNVANFGEPETRRLQFVVLKDQAAAQRVAEAARGGKKLIEVAKAVQPDAKLQILDSVKAADLPPAVAIAAFKTPKGETSEPVQSPLGWHVIQPLYIKAGTQKPLTALHSKIETGLRMQKVQESLPKTIDAIDDAISGGATLAELTKQYPFKLSNPPVQDNQGRNNGQLITGTDYTDVRTAAFKLNNPHETSDLVQRPDGKLMLVELNEIQPPRTPTLQEARALVLKDWQTQARRDQAEALAKQLKEKWADANARNALIRQANAVKVAWPLQTRSSNPALPVGVVGRMFKMPVNAPEQITDKDAQYVVSVAQIQPAKLADFTDAARQAKIKEALPQRQQEMLALYLAALREKYEVRKYPEKLESIYGPATAEE